MPHQPHDNWLDAWGFVALSLLLWASQRARPTPSNLWAVGIFLIAALTVWIFASRRPHSGASQAGGSDVIDVPGLVPETTEAAAEGVCPVCSRTVSGSDRVCACGAPRLTDADRQRLRGPGGWLAVVRLGLLVLAPLDVAAMIATWLSNGGDFSGGDWLRMLPPVLLVAGPVLYGVFVAALLASERPESVRHARQYLVANVICQVGLIVNVALRDGPRAAFALMGYLLGTLLAAYVWVRYFRQSRRVLVTYGPGALRSGVSLPTLAAGAIAVAIIVLVPLAILRTFWPSTGGMWLSYAPAAGGFRLELPGVPSLSDESYSEGDGTFSVLSTALVETWDGTAFSVSHGELPPHADLSDPAGILDAMVEGAIEPAGLQDGQEIAVQGLSGREFLAHDPARQLSLAGRVFLAGRKTITLVAVTPGERTATQAAASDRFLKSFALTGR